MDGFNATTSSRGKMLLKLDFANMFNSIYHQTPLTRTVSAIAGIARWVPWCHQSSSTLLCGAAAIQSPLVHTLMQELQAGPLDFALFYLDDGIVADDVAAVGP